MKKVILLSFYYTPCTLTPAQRNTFWAEHFHKLGIYPIVLTRAWNHTIRTHNDTKRALGDSVVVEKLGTHEVHYLPFRPGMLDWAYLNFGETVLRPLFLAIKVLDVLLARFTLAFSSYRNFLPYLEHLVKTTKPNFLIVSGEPFYLFRLGYCIFRNTGLTWLADYRDDWSTNQLQMEKSGGVIRKWIAAIESSYEKKWVGTAQKIISVSDVYTERVSRFLKKPGVTIQNGFEEEILDIPNKDLPPVFTVMYSGVVYPSQDLSMIIQVLERCEQLGKPFRLVFLGAGFDVKEQRRIQSLVPTHLRTWVQISQRYPRPTALEMLRESHAFLGVAYGEMKGIPSSKLYEYMALGKPVLLCPSDGDIMEAMLTRSGLGFFCQNVEEGVQKIQEIMNLYAQPEQLVALKVKARAAIMPYSRMNQLTTLANHLGD